MEYNGIEIDVTSGIEVDAILVAKIKNEMKKYQLTAS